jgi:polyhydroxybutyrate depolymerase
MRRAVLVGLVMAAADCHGSMKGPGPLPAPPADAAAPPAAARSPGCGAATALPEGPGTLDVGGAARSYTLRLPAGYTSERAWPLVLALHPNGGAGVDYWDGSERPLRQIVRDQAVLVLPVARGAAGNWDWRGDLPADLAYFDALIGRLESGLCVDTTRIFAMGFSGGGSFAGVLGCARKDIRAIATGGAVTYFDPATCAGTPAAWITIGAGELIPAREAFRDFWRTRAGCQPAVTEVPPAGCLAYACPAASPVVYCPHPGGHQWPDFGTSAAWDFFSRL